jgi:polysaccharide biosynthesis protein PslA
MPQSAPNSIFQNSHITLLSIVDVLVGAFVFLILRTVHPALDVELPKFLLLPHLPMMVQTAIFTLFWPLLFSLAGLTRQLGRKGFGWYSSAHWTTCLAGTIVFAFFFFVKNDYLFHYGFFHFVFEFYLTITALLWLPKALYYWWMWWAMRTGRAFITVLLVGGNGKALMVYNNYMGNSSWYKYRIAGYLTINNEAPSVLPQSVAKLGDLAQLAEVIDKHPVDEVVVAIDSHDYKKVEFVLASIRHKSVTIKLLPDLSALLEGTVKTADIKGIPLITINNRLMPEWQMVMKWLFDKTVAITALLLFLPFFPFVAILIKRGSPGPLFYLQQRIGKNKKPFNIIKFRSMHVNAENSGPALSSHNDPRITSFGRILRKWHIDEIPQFINVLKGNMSIVGPRPERQFFIDQMVKLAPHYNHLFCVKPGITSWGMVKYGYAENVQQMLERLEYDILYLENISFVVDMKIILYTITEIYSGRGK